MSSSVWRLYASRNIYNLRTSYSTTSRDFRWIGAYPSHYLLNTLRPRQDGRLFPDDIFKSIFFKENVQIVVKISLTCIPKAPNNNIPALVQIMTWRRLGDKPLSEAIMVSLLTNICVTRPQWVNTRHQFISVWRRHFFITQITWIVVASVYHLSSILYINSTYATSE